ncbi:MAG TPA: CusA/CzcA family heavy metal efflux RND transporter [Myxococcales bacterium]|nr:CusA/CzcA family heavy metal efflux RND transporter [Myxococcales bacterium]
MIQRAVDWALKTPSLVVLFALAAIAVGIWAFDTLDVEAYPLPTPPLVEVISQPIGWSAEEVERYVTVPTEVGLSGMPGLEHMRSQSIFGLSDVKCYFKWGTTYEAGRQEVINRLATWITLPPGVTAGISPWNAIGEVFRYKLEGKGYTLAELKSAEDWILEKNWRQVPGVVDVTSYGGETKQYWVDVDPMKLKGYGLTLAQVENVLGNANVNVGGGRLPVGEESFDVRGIGLIHDVHDIEHIVISEEHGTPIRVMDVAAVSTGHAPRLGIVGMDDEPDIVQGIVLMKYGGETLPTLEGIYRKLDEIKKNHLLPPGMEVVPYYNRGTLTHLTTHTVVHNALEGMFLVTVLLFFFLGSGRAALITAINIPIALLIAFAGMKLTDTPANLISLGALDFGIVVDSTVIMIENVFRHLGSHGVGSMKERIRAAASEVGGPMAISTLIIATAFLPLFMMSGAEGVIFAPMARTYAFAIGGAILLALSLTPVLAARFIKPDTEHDEGRLMGFFHRLYNPLFDQALRRPKLAVAICAIPIFACVALFPLLGKEFMPSLEEGNFWVRCTFPAAISLDQSARYVPKIRNILLGCPLDAKAECDPKTRRHPEVERVVSQLGRPDDGTDLAGFNNLELFAPLQPFEDWPSGLTKAKLADELTRELQKEFPGVLFNFSQYISDNVEEAVSGVKGENSVKVVGPDLATDDKKAGEIVDVMSKVEGVKDLGVFKSIGQPDLKITVDRLAAERYGLNTGDVNAVIQAAVGGTVLSQVYEGEQHYDLRVRWAEPYRRNLDAIRHITVPTPDGNYIPLAQLAKFEMVEGPTVIYRQEGYRYTPVKFSVRGRDLASTIADVRRQIAKHVKLPYDTHLVWEGQINEMNAAFSRLAIIIPLTLLLIMLLVYRAAGNMLDLTLILINIPVACTGGVLALLATGTNFSASAAMGFVSVFGIAVQDALLMVSYFQQLHGEEGLSVEQAARLASQRRFRPVLMTTLVATLGLLPAALSHGIGADTVRPLAIVVIGGSLQLAFLTRVLQPPLRVLAHNWLRSRQGRHAPPPVPTPAAGGALA